MEDCHSFPCQVRMHINIKYFNFSQVDFPHLISNNYFLKLSSNVLYRMWCGFIQQCLLKALVQVNCSVCCSTWVIKSIPFSIPTTTTTTNFSRTKMNLCHKGLPIKIFRQEHLTSFKYKTVPIQSFDKSCPIAILQMA